MTTARRFISLLLAPTLAGAPTAALARDFDWSGRSDVYVDELWGQARTGASVAPFQATSLGWGYRFCDCGLYLNAFLRARDAADFNFGADASLARLTLSGTGYGLGLGIRREAIQLEAGGIEDDIRVKGIPFDEIGEPAGYELATTTYTISGPYVRLGIDLFQWQHVLLQANAQVESLQGMTGDATAYLPRRQYVASAGLSLHATEINSAIPAAVVGTVLLIALLAKSKSSGSSGSTTLDFGVSRSDDCRDQKRQKSDCAK